MGRLFAPDSGLNRVLGTLADIVLLNLLFLFCSIPVITIGASFSAMYSVALKIASDRSGGVFKPFFRAFKGSFLKATAMWLIYLALGAAIYFGLAIINAEGMSWFFKLIYGIITVLLLISLAWVWALEAQFENGIFRTMKNSLILGITHPFITVAAAALNLLLPASLLLGGDVFARLGFIWFLFGFSGIAILNSRMFGGVFAGYIEQMNKAAAAGAGKEDRNAESDAAGEDIRKDEGAAAPEKKDN